MTRRMYYYRVGVGYAGVALEYHLVKAPNEMDARRYGLRAFLRPDKGFDHIETIRMPKEKARLYKGFESCPIAVFDR